MSNEKLNNWRAEVENYQYPAPGFDADAAWQRLEQRRHATPTHRIKPLYWYAAGCLLLIPFFFWIKNHSGSKEISKPIVKQQTIISQPSTSNDNREAVNPSVREMNAEDQRKSLPLLPDPSVRQYKNNSSSTPTILQQESLKVVNEKPLLADLEISTPDTALVIPAKLPSGAPKRASRRIVHINEITSAPAVPEPDPVTTTPPPQRNRQIFTWVEQAEQPAVGSTPAETVPVEKQPPRRGLFRPKQQPSVKE
jgi:hypothetical protein